MYAKAFYGKKLPHTNSSYKIFRNFDFKQTIEKNLKNYSREHGTIIPDRLYFNQNIRRYNPWHIIILVDESGSMLDSVIYTAVMASIFAKMPFLSVKLAIFDTVGRSIERTSRRSGRYPDESTAGWRNGYT